MSLISNIEGGGGNSLVAACAHADVPIQRTYSLKTNNSSALLQIAYIFLFKLIVFFIICLYCIR